jgi:hypothetical protein
VRRGAGLRPGRVLRRWRARGSARRSRATWSRTSSGRSPWVRRFSDRIKNVCDTDIGGDDLQRRIVRHVNDDRPRTAAGRLSSGNARVWCGPRSFGRSPVPPRAPASFSNICRPAAASSRDIGWTARRLAEEMAFHRNPAPPVSALIPRRPSDRRTLRRSPPRRSSQRLAGRKVAATDDFPGVASVSRASQVWPRPHRGRTYAHFPPTPPEARVGIPRPSLTGSKTGSVSQRLMLESSRNRRATSSRQCDMSLVASTTT